MKVLSLFDGIGGCKQALKELNIDCRYYASEIDKYAIQVAKANHSDIEHIGDVREVKEYSNIDLLIGGSPCQDLSIAKKDRKGLEGKRSGLFYEYLRILNETKPKHFILENVASMSKADKQEITDTLGIDPILINSALLTAQQRKRLYWVGKLVDGKYKQVKIEQPEDKGIVLKDIIEEGVADRDKSYTIDANYWKGGNLKSYFEKHRRQLVFQPLHTSERGRRLTPCGTKRDDKGGKIVRGFEIRPDGKTCALTTVQKDNYITEDYKIRKLTVTECCRLQGFPDNYVSMVSNTQGYKGLGNSFTVPVIKHILKNIFYKDNE